MDEGFTVKDRGRYHRDGLAGYEPFFAQLDGSHKVLLEATPGYLYQDTALKVLAEQLPQTKILFVLRRPADRLLSTYRYFSNNWGELNSDRVDFESYVEMTLREDDALEVNEFLRRGFAHGRYVDWLQLWVDRCGSERIKILVLESWLADRSAGMQDLAEWCGLDASFYERYRYPKENEAYRVRLRSLQRLNVWMRERLPQSSLRERLRRIYRRLNTAPPERPEALETAQLQRLDELYADANRDLAERFDLDLSSWCKPRPQVG